MIDLPSASSRDMPRLEKIVADIGTGDVNAFYLHLCEGVRGDERSAKEFQAFLDSGRRRPRPTSSTARRCRRATCIRWPTPAAGWCGHRSRTCGSTVRRRWRERRWLGNARGARGGLVAVRVDQPAGEMKVARRQLALEGHPIAAADLVAMVTSVAAGWPDCPTTWGRSRPGARPTSWFWSGTTPDPYESVCLRRPVLGRAGVDRRGHHVRAGGLVRPLSGNAASPTIESLVAWGSRCGSTTGSSRRPRRRPRRCRPSGPADGGIPCGGTDLRLRRPGCCWVESSESARALGYTSNRGGGAREARVTFGRGAGDLAHTRVSWRGCSRPRASPTSRASCSGWCGSSSTSRSSPWRPRWSMPTSTRRRSSSRCRRWASSG